MRNARKDACPEAASARRADAPQRRKRERAIRARMSAPARSRCADGSHREAQLRGAAVGRQEHRRSSGVAARRRSRVPHLRQGASSYANARQRGFPPSRRGAAAARPRSLRIRRGAVAVVRGFGGCGRSCGVSSRRICFGRAGGTRPGAQHSLAAALLYPAKAGERRDGTLRFTQRLECVHDVSTFASKAPRKHSFLLFIGAFYERFT